MVLEKIPTFSEVKNWVNNNADVPNADFADNAGDADTVGGAEPPFVPPIFGNGADGNVTVNSGDLDKSYETTNFTLESGTYNLSSYFTVIHATEKITINGDIIGKSNNGGAGRAGGDGTIGNGSNGGGGVFSPDGAGGNGGGGGVGGGNGGSGGDGDTYFVSSRTRINSTDALVTELENTAPAAGGGGGGGGREDYDGGNGGHGAFPSGAGGGGSAITFSADGGDGGSGGGLVVLIAPTIEINGLIDVSGDNGGAGNNTGGGGGGGCGGAIMFRYTSIDESTATYDVSGGVGGNGGEEMGGNGGDGANGADGIIRRYTV